MRRGGKWRSVGTMRLRGGRYLYRPQLGKHRQAARGAASAACVSKRSARVLRLRAYVKGAGRSNIVRVRIGR